jgi:hypothetical protein
MALPDYSNYSYRGYRAAQPKDQRADMMNRRAFRRYKRDYQPEPVNPQLPAQHPGFQGTVTSPQTSSQHPFFDPNSNYAQTGRQYGRLPGGPGSSAVNIYGTDVNPEGYYYATLNERGLGGLDARSQAAQGMYRDAALGYQAAKTRNMELWFPEYLEQWNPSQVLDQMSNEQLGIDDSRFQGRDRWGMRGGL